MGKSGDFHYFVMEFVHGRTLYELLTAPNAGPLDQERAIEIIIGQLVNLYRAGEAVRMSKRTGEMVTFDELIEDRVATGFEMLIDNFSAGILGGAMAEAGAGFSRSWREPARFRACRRRSFSRNTKPS